MSSRVSFINSVRNHPSKMSMFYTVALNLFRSLLNKKNLSVQPYLALQRVLCIIQYIIVLFRATELWLVR